MTSVERFNEALKSKQMMKGKLSIVEAKFCKFSHSSTLLILPSKTTMFNKFYA